MRYDCIIPSENRTQLLLVRQNGAWALPSVTCAKGWIAEAVPDIRDGFRRQYGGDIAVLQIVSWLPETVTCEVELLAPVRYAEWRAVDELADSPAVALWREGTRHEPVLSPWQQRGWLADARAWIGARLAPLDDIVQIKAGWNGSCVLRADSGRDRLYFKASQPRKPGEPAVIRALAESWPEHVPRLVDADEERCWMLMREIDGQPIDSKSAADLSDAARLMARIQIGEAERIERWEAMGCLDRGLGVLRAGLGRFLGHIPAGLCEAGVISREERDQIAAFIPGAEAMCDALGSAPVPHRSIHHEDFRDGNAYRARSGRLVLIDWNDTVVSHPFFTAQRFLWFLPNDEAAQRMLRDAYLEPFTVFASRRDLLGIFELATRLAPVYDMLRFDAAGRTDEVLRRGLTAEERGIARYLAGHLLRVSNPVR